jgi:phage-related protein
MPLTTIHVFREADGSRPIPLMQWLDQLEKSDPEAYGACLDRILRLHRQGNELRRPIADALRNGIRELRAKKGRVHYRMLYTFTGPNTALITHGFTKEGKVPAAEIDRAVERVALVRAHPGKYIAIWSLD